MTKVLLKNPSRHRGSFDDYPLINAAKRYPVIGTKFITHIEHQHCRSCCNTELIIVTMNRGAITNTLAARLLASTYSVPVLILAYDPRDKAYRRGIDVILLDNKGRLIKAAVGVSWDAYIDTKAWARRLSPCYGHDDCVSAAASYRDNSNIVDFYPEQLEQVGDKQSDADSIPANYVHMFHIDVNKDNRQRIRQMDLDGVLFCAGCGAVEAFVEATSDKRKYMTLTRTLARDSDALAFILRHHPGDADNKHPIQLAGWNPDGTRIEIKNPQTWESIQLIFELSHRRHLAKSPKCETSTKQLRDRALALSKQIPLVITKEVFESAAAIS